MISIKSYNLLHRAIKKEGEFDAELTGIKEKFFGFVFWIV